ncbi:cysteine-rich receptor-like protein kinase 28 [Quercus suber]|uniref:Cysteine-rich receptor-like protein kinase 28 n=1 Tax=Quercus suber TaxID=58331 RepID=A0AAW0L6Z3_QUESU
MKCIHIGLLCIQEAAANRHTMSKIYYNIPNPESDLVTEDAGALSQQFESKPEPSQQSINEVTITDLDPC